MRLGLDPPLVNCSGILSYVDVFELWEEMGAAIGAWITKSYGLKKRDGNENITVYSLENGAINSMGLSNPGVRKKDGSVNGAALEELKEAGLKKPLIISVMGLKPAEYADVVGLMEEHAPNAAGYELNLSCPNKTPGEESITVSLGDSPKLVGESVDGVRKITKKPIIAKISPKCDVRKIASAAEEAGADYIGCANTVPALTIDKFRWRPVLAGGSGGLSGPALKATNMKVVFDAFEAVDRDKTGIIAYGGIENADDIIEYCLAGAEFFGLGTVFKDKTTEQAVAKTKDIYESLGLKLEARKTGLKDMRGAAHV